MNFLYQIITSAYVYTLYEEDGHVFLHILNLKNEETIGEEMEKSKCLDNEEIDFSKSIFLKGDKKWDITIKII